MANILNITNGDCALTFISEGEKLPGKVFARSQASEDRIFLGDSSFWIILQELLDSNPALLEFSRGKKLTLPDAKNQMSSITSVGLEVLAGKRNWLEIANLNRWIGGVHLKPTNVWCWNSDSSSILERA